MFLELAIVEEKAGIDTEFWDFHDGRYTECIAEYEEFWTTFVGNLVHIK